MLGKYLKLNSATSVGSSVTTKCCIFHTVITSHTFARFIVLKRTQQINHSNTHSPQLLSNIYLFGIGLIFSLHRCRFSLLIFLTRIVQLFISFNCRTPATPAAKMKKKSLRQNGARSSTYHSCAVWPRINRSSSIVVAVNRIRVAFLSQQIFDTNRSHEQHEIIYCTIE